jgi:hypothetical protein
MVAQLVTAVLVGLSMSDETCTRKDDACVDLVPLACPQHWDRPSCDAERGCVWLGSIDDDDTDSSSGGGSSAFVCRPEGYTLQCSDMAAENGCIGVAGCLWYSRGTFCYPQTRFPCELIYEEWMCQRIGNNVHGVLEGSDVCEWDYSTHVCLAKGAPAPCDMVGNPAVCAARGCEWSPQQPNPCHDPAKPTPLGCTDVKSSEACAGRSDCRWHTNATDEAMNSCYALPTVEICVEKDFVAGYESALSCEIAGCMYVTDVPGLPSRNLCLEKGASVCP